jgi:hypothetical protein
VQMWNLGLEVPRPTTHAHITTCFHVHASALYFQVYLVFVGHCTVFRCSKVFLSLYCFFKCFVFFFRV